MPHYFATYRDPKTQKQRTESAQCADYWIAMTRLPVYIYPNGIKMKREGSIRTDDRDTPK